MTHWLNGYFVFLLIILGSNVISLICIAKVRDRIIYADQIMMMMSSFFFVILNFVVVGRLKMILVMSAHRYYTIDCVQHLLPLHIPVFHWPFTQTETQLEIGTTMKGEPYQISGICFFVFNIRWFVSIWSRDRYGWHSLSLSIQAQFHYIYFLFRCHTLFSLHVQLFYVCSLKPVLYDFIFSPMRWQDAEEKKKNVIRP